MARGYTATVIVEEFWYDRIGDPKSSILRTETYDNIASARDRQRVLDREYADDETCFTDIIVETEE